ncbi:MAG: D-alanyl-D-alanine carboxypeptidase/D-alanyl-D-alanine endopeptidase, partial [Longimicrobiales bacterium]
MSSPRPAEPAPSGSNAPQVAALRAELERTIGSPGWRSAEWSVMVVSLEHGDTIFEHQAHRALAPASNMKLFTSAAALYYLGPGFRYHTYLVVDGPIRSGVLEGDVILYGTGDPAISDQFHDSKTTVLEEFADALERAGVREVRGALVGDGSYFTGSPVGLGWKVEDINTWYAAPAGALSEAENMVTMVIRPGEQVGARPRVQLLPESRGIAIVNQATTVSGGAGRVITTRAAYDGPILITGEVGTGQGPIWRSVPVADPARYAAAAFLAVLDQRGIRVDGGVRSVRSAAESPITGRSVFAAQYTDRPPLRTLHVHNSPPLLELLKVLNKQSHNFYGEQILRTVGRHVFGIGSAEAGARAILALLQAEGGIDPEHLRIYDGSGLSWLNRSDAATIIDLLDLMYRSPMFDEYVATLPAAGERGLRRMGNSAAIGNLHAKTGTIQGVSALSGYVHAANGELLAFSIISNAVPSTWRAKRVEDAIGMELAAFTRPEPTLLARALGDDEDDEAARTPEAEPSVRPGAPAIDVDAASSTRTHTVQPGETLTGISRAYGITLQALEEANPNVNPRRLQLGQQLEVPVEAAAVADVADPAGEEVAGEVTPERRETAGDARPNLLDPAS